MNPTVCFSGLQSDMNDMQIDAASCSVLHVAYKIARCVASCMIYFITQGSCTVSASYGLILYIAHIYWDADCVTQLSAYRNGLKTTSTFTLGTGIFAIQSWSKQFGPLHGLNRTKGNKIYFKILANFKNHYAPIMGCLIDIFSWPQYEQWSVFIVVCQK